MASVKVVVHEFGINPDNEFIDGVLKGFRSDQVDWRDYNTERCKKLFEALGVSRYDEDYVLGKLPDGRYALVGPTQRYFEFAVEEYE